MRASFKKTVGFILFLICNTPGIGLADVGDGAFITGNEFQFDGTFLHEVQGVDTDEFAQNGWTCTDHSCPKNTPVEAKCKVDMAFAFAEGAMSHWTCTGSGIEAIKKMTSESPALSGFWIRNQAGICHVTENAQPQNLLKLSQNLWQWFVSPQRWEYSCPKDDLFVVAQGAWADNMANPPCDDNGEPCTRVEFSSASNRACVKKTVELEDTITTGLCMDDKGVMSVEASFEGGSVQKIALKRIQH